MRYTKEQLNFEDGLKKEWLITNGIGGYASSSIMGINTRKYHGLLVAALTPPARRSVILSKVDEAIRINGKDIPIYSNIGKDYVTKGYKYLEGFEKKYIPIFTYKVKGILIKKMICMEYGKNTVTILYIVENIGYPTTLVLTPVMNFRDFHTTTFNKTFDLQEQINENKVKVIVDKKSETPVYLYCSEGTYIKHCNDTFKNMYYVEEENRGLDALENLAVPGRYEINLEPNEQKCITFTCSLEANIEEVDAKDVINKEIGRISGLLYESKLLENKNLKGKEELVRDYIIASDNFIAYRTSFALYTIIAGYPWFLDWGRDTLISFEGILLMPKRFKEAREVLLTCIRDTKYGLVPNGYSGYDNRPLYNSADASLLLFEQVKKYLQYTNDYEFVKERMYKTLIKIIEAYISGIDVDGNNIHLDSDYLLSSGTPNIQNTWMDAKVGDYVVTPRNGKTVEINSLWYNALRIMANLTKLYNDEDLSNKYKEYADKCKENFNKEFYNKKKKSLYDVLGDDKIRPNQLFSLSLTYPIIDPSSDIASEIFNTVTKKLLLPKGLRTLAQDEENYVGIYEGGVYERDTSYHQGITWPWLLGPYFDAFVNIINSVSDEKRKTRLIKAYNKFIELVQNQGGDIEYVKDVTKFEKARIIQEVISTTEGYVQEINAEEIGKLSCDLGAGRKTKKDKIDLQVGIILNKKLGDFVNKGDKLATIYANDREKAKDTENELLRIYKIGKEKIEENTIIDIIE